ncbi:MAG: TatD family hydrolase [Coriobacteriia bacterium]|nr:TatD family hydrolase [Coriobacteriia bacterium]
MSENRETPIEPSALPVLGAPLADTHAHLDMLPDPAGALARAAVAGVRLVLTVADLTEAGEEWLDGLPGLLAEARERLGEAGGDAGPPDVRVVVGAHPHNASAWRPGLDERMLALASRPEVVAFGEVGLDFHYDHSPRDAQLAVFREHLGLAHEAGLPVIVHLREAHEAGREVLDEIGVPPAGAVLHCFTEGPEWAQTFLDRGCHVSFSGLATFKKAEAVRAAAAVVPPERLLVETDAPFLAPEPYRGRRNEPALVTLTAARLAASLGVPAEELARVSYANARRLFGLEKEDAA